MHNIVAAMLRGSRAGGAAPAAPPPSAVRVPAGPSADKRLPPALDTPVVLMIGTNTEIADRLAMLCGALRIRLLTVTSLADLVPALYGARPVGLACALEGTRATVACEVVRAVARYRPTLTTLLFTDDDPETLGILDAIVGLCRLTDLQRMTRQPGSQDLLGFLARAGRRSGRLGLVQA